MLLFKLNQLDESLLTDDVYFLSCNTINEKKYITSVIGKNFTQVDDNSASLVDVTLSTSIAYLYNPTIVCCSKNMLPVITTALNANKTIYIIPSLNIITSKNQITVDDDISDLDIRKLQLLQKVNMLIKNYVPTLSLSSFMKCSLYIQKLIIENKVCISFNANTDYNTKEQILAYLTEDTVSDELKTTVTELLENLPLDTLPTISDLDFENINEEEINTLDSYLNDVNKLTRTIKKFYTFIKAMLYATDIEQLAELEKKFILNYYTQLILLCILMVTCFTWKS